MSDNHVPTDNQPVNRLDIIYIFQAYNRHELTYDELIEQTRAWAETMRRQYGQPKVQALPKPATPD